MKKYAEESKAVKKLRRKVKDKLKAEEQIMSKRMLKKISKVIQLKLAKNELDQALEKKVAPQQPIETPALKETPPLEKLKKRIKKDEKKLSQNVRHDLKIKPISSISISSLSSSTHRAKQIILPKRKLKDSNPLKLEKPHTDNDV